MSGFSSTSWFLLKKKMIDKDLFSAITKEQAITQHKKSEK